jgi:hypothetical protein
MILTQRVACDVLWEADGTSSIASLVTFQHLAPPLNPGFIPWPCIPFHNIAYIDLLLCLETYLLPQVENSS